MCLFIVGIGPGKPEGMTKEAEAVLEGCEVIAGYTVYTALLKERFPEKEYYATPMRQETERCRWALSQAAMGRRTALVCSGDAGIYGMAGLVCQLSAGMENGPAVRVIPGVTAASSGAALLGAPLGHDFAVISLSDLLTDAAVIRSRVRYAAMGDLVICLYNPASRKRVDYLKKACDIVLAYRSPDTVCGYVRNIGREGEEIRILSLGELREIHADMFTTVFIGNSTTLEIGGRMVTPRGYRTIPPDRVGQEEQTDAGGTGREPTAASSPDAGRVVIFGGTTEGRQLYEYCRKRGLAVSVYVATEYGSRILEPDGWDPGRESGGAGIPGQIRCGRLEPEEMKQAIAQEQARLVLDATHPFARKATEHIRAACAQLGIPYRRVCRAAPEEEDVPEGIYFDSIEEAVSFLEGKDGNVLATTGSRDLDGYRRLAGYRERLYVRILPDAAAISSCLAMGIGGRHLAAMQGPFSEEMNYGFLKEFAIRWMVTKQSGAVGGFPEKRNAAKRAGAALLIIRNQKETGVSLQEALDILEELK